MQPERRPSIHPQPLSRPSSGETETYTADSTGAFKNSVPEARRTRGRGLSSRNGPYSTDRLSLASRQPL